MLLSQVKLGTPSIWMKTSDIYRMNDYILSSKLRQFYSIIPGIGFSKYVNNQWKPILVDMQTEEGTTQTVTYDLVVAYQWMKEQQDSYNYTFIHNLLSSSESFMTMYAGLFANSYMAYREAFYKDDHSSFPIQHLVFSSEDCPKECISFFKIIESQVMSIEEIKEIIFHFNSVSDGLLVDKADVNDIAKAALGLSEFDFINLSLMSILSKSKIDSKYIYESKMKNIKQNGILEIIKPSVTFDNIGGLDNAKDIINRNVWLWNNPQEAEKFGIQPIRRMLMVGVPGTGKSAICEATASALNLDLARTGVSQVMNSFVGQSEANMRAVFGQIKAMAPLCVWIDEFGRDLSGGASSSHVDGGTTDRVHGEFLTGLQELPEDVFLICAANQLENLRPEMLRADRFDKIMFVGLPSFVERESIFEIYLNSIKTDHSFDLSALASATTGFTGAEIKSLIKETKFYVVSSEYRPINTQDILTYAPKMRNILWNKSRQTIKDLYATALEQWDFASSTQLEDAPLILNGTYAKMSTNNLVKPKGNW